MVPGRAEPSFTQNLINPEMNWRGEVNSMDYHSSKFEHLSPRYPPASQLRARDARGPHTTEFCIHDNTKIKKQKLQNMAREEQTTLQYF